MSIEPIVDVEVPTVELTKKGTIRKRKPKKSNNKPCISKSRIVF